MGIISLPISTGKSLMTITHLTPVYSTRGDVEAFLTFPYLYNRMGEWIGWVTTERKVYSVHGLYVGYYSKDNRILRKQSDAFGQEHLKPPEAPQGRITIPAHVPLAPLMAELAFGVIDVLLEQPDLLPSLDFGEGREDLG
jgi:hypothetical protein